MKHLNKISWIANIGTVLFALSGPAIRLGARVAASRVAVAAATTAAVVGVGQLELIDREGTRYEAYYDVAGIPTICVGHTSDAEYPFKMGDVWTQEQCDEVFEHDHKEALDAVDALVTVPLKAYQRNALASFVFNVGRGAFARSTLLRLLNSGDYDAVPRELRKWNKITKNGRKVVSQGLINRREKEVAQWLGQ